MSRMRLPSDYPINIVSNYKILGVNESDPIDVITMKYKELVKMLHPDIPVSAEAAKIGWTKKEKDLAYISVKKAYTEIKKEKEIERNYPDYEMNYEIESEFINAKMENVFLGEKIGLGFDDNPDQKIDQDSIDERMRKYRYNNQEYHQKDFNQQDFIPQLNSKFDNQSFNKNFEMSRQRDIENGFSDPFSKGYDLFNSKEAEEERKYIEKHKHRPDINVTMKPTHTIPKINENGALVEYDYFNDNNYNVLSTIPTMELGINKVNDFSVVISQDRGKQLYGSDLMSVYGENREYWEDSVKRDPELMRKYYDDTSVDVKMSRYMNERVDFDNKVVDDDIKLKMDEYTSQKKLADYNRKLELKKLEQFYADKRLR